MNSGVPSSTGSSSKLPTILMTVLVTAIVIIAGMYALGFVAFQSGDVVVESVTPTPPASMSVSLTPEATTTPTTVTQSKVYSNQYLSVTIPAGWSYSTTQSGAINITKNNYILYINPRAQQASGVEGGRFGEIALGAPSADAAVLEWPGPCSAPVKTSATGGYSRYDYYTDRSYEQPCVKYPTDGSVVWYFSYMSKDGGYFNHTSTIQAPYGYVITMAYNSKDVNKLPRKSNATLNAMLGEMTSIAKTLVINSTAGLKTYIDEQNGFEFKYSNSLVLENPSKLQGMVVALGTSADFAQWARECPSGNCMGSPYMFYVTTMWNTTLSQYIKEQGSSPSRIQTTLDGKLAYEEVHDVELPYYIITTENKGVVYRLVFLDASSKANFSSEQKQILSTFHFTK